MRWPVVVAVLLGQVSLAGPDAGGVKPPMDLTALRSPDDAFWKPPAQTKDRLATELVGHYRGELLNVLDLSTRGALQDGLARGAFSTDVQAVLRRDSKEPLHAWAFTGEAFVGPIDVPVK